MHFIPVPWIPWLTNSKTVLSRVKLREPNTPLLVEHHGNLDVRRGGDRARQVGTADQGHGEVLRPTRYSARRPHRVLVEVGPGGSLTASAIRQPRWAVAAPRRSADASPAAEQRRPRHLPARPRPTVVRRSRRRLVAPARGPSTALISLPGYPFARQKHWVDPRRSVPMSRDRPFPSATVTPPPPPTVPTGGAAAGGRQQQIEATLQRIWSESLGTRLDRPQRQLLRTRRRFGERNRYRDEPGQGRPGPHRRKTCSNTRVWPRCRPRSPPATALAGSPIRPVALGIRLFRRTSRTSSSTDCAKPVAGASRSSCGSAPR